MRDARHQAEASLRATAIRMLARREYPRAELEDRLLARGADRGEVVRILDELERLGYLSDVRFAQMIVARKAGRFGKQAIAHAIRARRVDPAAARAALDAVAASDEVADARELWRRRFGTAPADERARARQIRFLLARGYGLSVALDVVGRSPRGASGDAVAHDAEGDS